MDNRIKYLSYTALSLKRGIFFRKAEYYKIKGTCPHCKKPVETLLRNWV